MLRVVLFPELHETGQHGPRVVVRLVRVSLRHLSRDPTPATLQEPFSPRPLSQFSSASGAIPTLSRWNYIILGASFPKPLSVLRLLTEAPAPKRLSITQRRISGNLGGERVCSYYIIIPISSSNTKQKDLLRKMQLP